MGTVDGLARHIDRMIAAIEDRQQPKQVLPSPFVFLDDNGRDWPGCEESNRQAERRATWLGIPAKTYIGIDPNEDSSEPWAA